MSTPFGGFSGISSAGAVSGQQEIKQLAELADYLVGQGFTKQSAAGIASTVAGESTGSPESVGSGGAGLIGWTPASSMNQYGGTIHGDPNHDMETQAAALIKYAQANQAEAKARGGVDLATLKAATDASQAAGWFSQFEGPLNPGSDERKSLIAAISAAIGAPISGLGTGGTPTGAAGGETLVEAGFNPLAPFLGFFKDISGQATGVADVATSITSFASELSAMIKWISWLFQPKNWVRIVSGFMGAVLLILGSVMLLTAAK
jgi:hypothetical protein